jgi:hypothetical protein
MHTGWFAHACHLGWVYETSITELDDCVPSVWTGLDDASFRAWILPSQFGRQSAGKVVAVSPSALPYHGRQIEMLAVREGLWTPADASFQQLGERWTISGKLLKLSRSGSCFQGCVQNGRSYQLVWNRKPDAHERTLPNRATEDSAGDHDTIAGCDA